jgi:hypothetical protein
MAHARRRFSDAVKAQGRNKKRGKAHRGLALIRKLYRAESQARDWPCCWGVMARLLQFDISGCLKKLLTSFLVTVVL